MNIVSYCVTEGPVGPIASSCTIIPCLSFLGNQDILYKMQQKGTAYNTRSGVGWMLALTLF